MTRIPPKSRALLASCTAALLLLGGCDQGWFINGRVTRCSDGDPLVGVSVFLQILDEDVDRRDEDLTTPDGAFSMGPLSPYELPGIVTLEKPHYVTLVREYVRAPGPNAPQEFCLEATP
jgi:hypothetical protein